MKERPILFSAPMVRALLDGTKMQTRRVIKPVGRDDGFVLQDYGEGWWPYRSDDGESAIRGDGTEEPHACPYGVPGDRLWVRETFAKIAGQTQPWIETDYRATYTHGDRLGDTLGIKKKWTPAIHMPRAASRITLEVTEVRVERLQDISAPDAVAEGIVTWRDGWDQKTAATMFLHGTRARVETNDGPVAKRLYMLLWEEINGAGSWNANPWVWAVSFRRIEP